MAVTLVVDGKPQPTQRLQSLPQLTVEIQQTFIQLHRIAAVVLAAFRVQLSQTLSHGFGNPRAVVRIKPDVRITLMKMSFVRAMCGGIYLGSADSGLHLTLYPSHLSPSYHRTQ